MLSRTEFESACKCLIISQQTPGMKGWSWNEHANIPGLGFMSRSAVLFRRSAHITEQMHVSLPVEDLDGATLPMPPETCETLTSLQYVVYSTTFQVPVFYFTIHDSNGSPLQLEELIRASLFHPFDLQGTDLTSFALSLPASSFPLLSQGDHPTLGTPCWYLHPCGTAAAVEEVMKEVEHDWTEDQRLMKWMEVWFMVLGTIIDLRN